MRSVRTNGLATYASAKKIQQSASGTRDKPSSGIVPCCRRVICVTAPINEVDLIAINTSVYNPADTNIVINLWQRPSIRIETRDIHEAALLVIIVIASVL